MKVLEVLNQYPGETFIQEHVKALIQYAPQIEIELAYTQTTHSGELKSPIEGIKAHAWPNYNLMKPWQQWIQSLKYRGDQWYKLYQPQRVLLRKVKPTHVHFHFSNLAVRYAHLCIELNIPFSFSIRGTDMHSLKTTNDTNYIQKLTAIGNQANGIHSVSNSLSEQLWETTKLKSTTIRTTVSDRYYQLKRQPQKNNWVAIGRLVWQKGFPYLIEACSQLQTRDFKLYIIGEGPMRQELEFMIRDLQLEEQVILVGYATPEKITEYLTRAEGLICPSIAEGFPNVLVEALAAGIPFIASSLGDIPLLFKQTHGCQLVQPCSAYQLTAALQQWLIKSPELISGTTKPYLAPFNSQYHATTFASFYNG